MQDASCEHLVSPCNTTLSKMYKMSKYEEHCDAKLSEIFVIDNHETNFSGPNNLCILPIQRWTIISRTGHKSGIQEVTQVWDYPGKSGGARARVRGLWMIVKGVCNVDFEWLLQVCVISSIPYMSNLNYSKLFKLI